MMFLFSMNDQVLAELAILNAVRLHTKRKSGGLNMMGYHVTYVRLLLSLRIIALSLYVVFPCRVLAGSPPATAEKATPPTTRASYNSIEVTICAVQLDRSKRQAIVEINLKNSGVREVLVPTWHPMSTPLFVVYNRSGQRDALTDCARGELIAPGVHGPPPVPIAPGQELSRRVNLFDYYRFVRPGVYALSVHFAPYTLHTGEARHIETPLLALNLSQRELASEAFPEVVLPASQERLFLIDVPSDGVSELPAFAFATIERYVKRNGPDRVWVMALTMNGRSRAAPKPIVHSVRDLPGTRQAIENQLLVAKSSPSPQNLSFALDAVGIFSRTTGARITLMSDCISRQPSRELDALRRLSEQATLDLVCFEDHSVPLETLRNLISGDIVSIVSGRAPQRETERR